MTKSKIVCRKFSFYFYTLHIRGKIYYENVKSHFPWHLLLRQTCMMLIVYEMTLKQRSEITNAFISNTSFLF